MRLFDSIHDLAKYELAINILGRDLTFVVFTAETAEIGINMVCILSKFNSAKRDGADFIISFVPALTIATHHSKGDHPIRWTDGND